MATVATVSASEPAGAGAPVDTSLEELRDAPDGQAVKLFKGDTAYELVVSKLGCDAVMWTKARPWKPGKAWKPMGGSEVSGFVCEIAPASVGAARALAVRELAARALAVGALERFKAELGKKAELIVVDLREVGAKEAKAAAKDAGYGTLASSGHGELHFVPRSELKAVKAAKAAVVVAAAESAASSTACTGEDDSTSAPLGEGCTTAAFSSVSLSEAVSPPASGESTGSTVAEGALESEGALKPEGALEGALKPEGGVVAWGRGAMVAAAGEAVGVVEQASFQVLFTHVTTGATHTVEGVTASMPVALLQRLIAEKSRSAVPGLVLEGRQLDASWTVGACGVSAGCTVHASGLLRGGGDGISHGKDEGTGGRRARARCGGRQRCAHRQKKTATAADADASRRGEAKPTTDRS